MYSTITVAGQPRITRKHSSVIASNLQPFGAREFRSNGAPELSELLLYAQSLYRKIDTCREFFPNRILDCLNAKSRDKREVYNRAELNGTSIQKRPQRLLRTTCITPASTVHKKTISFV